LVLALLTLAVAATTIGVAIASNTLSPVDATMGTANHRVTIPGSDPNLGAHIAAIQKMFGPTEVVAHQPVAVAGSVATVDLRDQDPKGVYGHATVRLAAGRYPNGPDEVAVAPPVAATFSLHIGDVWHQGGRDRRVVGLVENPQNLLDEFALVAPGQAVPPNEVSILLNTTDARFRAFHLGDVALSVEARSYAGQTAAATAVLALGTIGLLFVGLVAVAGFTVMAQRRLRAMGMLGAIGATDRHIRLVMLANGAVVGALAAIVGTVVGLLGWIAFIPHLEGLAGHRIDWFHLPWWAIAMAMLLAFLTAVAAAWWPARSAARIPIVAALSGRPPRPQPAHRFAAAGSALLLVGLSLLAFAHQKRPPLIVTGIVAITLGLLFLAPLGIAGLAVFARRAPIAVRLALRDLARYQARSGAAVAAVTLAIGIAATVAVSASAAEAEAVPTAGNLPTNQLLVYLAGPGPVGGGGPLPEQTPAQLQVLQARIDQIAALLHTQDVAALDAAVNPSTDVPRLGNSPAGKQSAALVRITPMAHGYGEELVSALYVATPALLQHYGITPSQVDPAADILTSRTDLAGLEIGSGPRETVKPKIQTLALPKYTSGPNTLITTEAVQKLGLLPVRSGWLIETPRPLTTAEINAARNSAAAAGLTIETRKPQKSLAPLRNWSTAIGLLVALGVLGMTVGLIRTETANDLRTLTAAGASSTIRRALTAATAGALALLGAVLGTAGAYLALIAWHRSNLHPLGHLPVVDLAIIIVGLPAAAATAGWLLAGNEPPTIARQPLE
ncbi:MAG: putative transport system permease protein, partial [Acidimicrobiaceae bacterium]|nr:putative transport system permease protein [Acidimicrobiaceae bacterium]